MAMLLYNLCYIRKYMYLYYVYLADCCRWYSGDPMAANGAEIGYNNQFCHSKLNGECAHNENDSLLLCSKKSRKYLYYVYITDSSRRHSRDPMAANGVWT